ncbi:MAG: hypothetical protein K0R26_2020 [Bacteroidota bacterium]|jgi:hypothetical protein|nr:hypothetical protein [Bacteroidota bacterium]
MIKKIALAFLFLFVVTAANAQKLNQFSSDSVKYIKELNEYFYDFSANKKDAEEYVLNFQKVWKSPDFSSKYRAAVYKTSNVMLQRKLKPYPYFISYLNAVVNFINSKQNPEVFDNWQLCIEKIFNSKNLKNFGEYLEMSENIFANNVFYKSPTYSYRSVETNYKFEFDSLPKVVFPKFTLVGASPRGDSISIENIQGIYYPSWGRFVGKGGRLSWKRTGVGDDVYADLIRVSLDCKTGGYTSDSATFVGKQYFDVPQKGRITDKIVTENREPTYPRFDSYSKRLVVKNIYPDVDYDGGFGMRGNKFVGSGNATNPAKIIFRRNNVKFLELSARSFSMTKDKINAKPAAVKFYLEKDSIIHPGLSFVYQVEQKTVTLLRTDDGLEKSPYFNTFHKVDMYFEQLVWKIDEPKMQFNFLPNNTQGEAFFESQDFFSSGRLEAIKGSENVSPVTKMSDYYNNNGNQLTFTTVDFAKYIKYLAVDLRPIIFKMAIFGLIYYEPETDIITIRPRLFDYTKNLKHQKDYDIITIHSVFPNNNNATMSLLNNTYDITIRGVENILLSDTQKVFIFPKRNELVLKKNRTIEFSGTVASGKFEFHGKDFVFDYDMFKVKMKTIDSCRIYVVSKEPDVNGNYLFKRVQTVIENLNGELRIDAPKNHSGYGKAPTFPQFQSFKESYTFYDKKSIFKGVYDRDKFYYKLDPFTMDSLDNFRNEGLVFEGEFSSADIFPTFREQLSLQPDYSLGFVRKTPPGGFQVYGGKAKFENEIKLSNKGLRADGDLNYVTSTTKSKDFIFFPDSMNTMANSYDIKEQIDPIEFPQVHGDTVYVHWMPYKDFMNATNKASPFKTYNNTCTFKGKYTLSPQELHGNGTVDMVKADLVATNILFKQHQYFSDTADFHLKAIDEEGITFASKNVNAKMDLQKRVGDFVANGDATIVEFVKNQYIAYMERFKWFMDSEEIQLGDETKKLNGSAENALDLEGPQFISVHPKQDSLRFLAPAAKYNLRKCIISCINVPFINVADARLYPDSGKVTIFRNAVMDTLKNTVILANTVTKYHTIRNVTANIFGLRSYIATGDYQYLDENNKPYLIKFNTIKPDTSGQTVSEGDISEEAKFQFNDYFSFAGKVYLFASNKFLTYDGGTKIVHACGKISKAYLKFNGEIDPKEILIPLPAKTTDMNGKPVGSAIIYGQDTNMVYSSFVSLRGGRKDVDVIGADGYLGFDKESREYRITNKEKFVEQSLPGNYISLNTDNCKVYAEGKMDLGADLGQVQFNTIGIATHSSINDSATFELMSTIDFFFDKGALKKMIKDVEVYNNTLQPIDFSNKVFNKGITEILGKEKGDKVISDLNLNGSIKRFPDEFEKTFLITNTEMRYDKTSRSFISTGPIGLGAINKTEIYRQVPGYIQIQRKKGGDNFTLYFELDPQTWYYFYYFKGVMSVVSSSAEFNNAIKELKSKDKKQDVKSGPSFQFTTASPSKRDMFLRKMKQANATVED